MSWGACSGQTEAHQGISHKPSKGEIMYARWIQVLTVLAVIVWFTGCMESPEMVPEANRELVREFTDATNAHDYEMVKSLLAPTFTRHCQATPEVAVSTPDAMVAYLKMNEATFPDEHIAIAHMVANDSLVSIWATYTGTQEGPMGPLPASHKRMTLDFASFFRVDSGRIAEMWVIWDNVTALKQLGYFPPPMPDSTW